MTNIGAGTSGNADSTDSLGTMYLIYADGVISEYMHSTRKHERQLIKFLSA